MAENRQGLRSTLIKTPPGLHRQFKTACANRGISMRRVFVRLMREFIRVMGKSSMREDADAYGVELTEAEIQAIFAPIRGAGKENGYASVNRDSG